MDVVERRSLNLEQQNLLALSPEMQEVLQIAVEEAATTGRGAFIDTADLLVGLSQIGKTGKTLSDAGINPEKIREAKKALGGYDYFNRLQPPQSQTTIQKWEQLPRTQRMRKIGIMIMEEAISSGNAVVEPEDALNVIIKEGWGIGARVLNYLGLSVNNTGLDRNNNLLNLPRRSRVKAGTVIKKTKLF